MAYISGLMIKSKLFPELLYELHLQDDMTVICMDVAEKVLSVLDKLEYQYIICIDNLHIVCYPVALPRPKIIVEWIKGGKS